MYTEREREREINMHIYIYIYIYCSIMYDFIYFKRQPAEGCLSTLEAIRLYHTILHYISCCIMHYIILYYIVIIEVPVI